MYITRWWSTKGIIQPISYEVNRNGYAYCTFNLWGRLGTCSFKIGIDVFETYDDALKACSDKINKKLCSLRKQVQKLEKLDPKRIPVLLNNVNEVKS